MIVIAVINLKGGSTKTTSAVFLAHALHEAGLSTLGVDADGENESFLHWSTSAEFPFPVIGMPVSNLHKNLPGITEGKYDAVVIDTPPMKEQRGSFYRQPAWPRTYCARWPQHRWNTTGCLPYASCWRTQRTLGRMAKRPCSAFYSHAPFQMRQVQVSIAKSSQTMVSES